MFFVTDFLQVSILLLSDTTLPDHDTIHGLETDMSLVLVTNYPQHFRSFVATLNGRLLVAGGRFVVCVHVCEYPCSILFYSRFTVTSTEGLQQHVTCTAALGLS